MNLFIKFEKLIIIISCILFAVIPILSMLGCFSKTLETYTPIIGKIINVGIIDASTSEVKYKIGIDFSINKNEICSAIFKETYVLRDAQNIANFFQINSTEYIYISNINRSSCYFSIKEFKTTNNLILLLLGILIDIFIAFIIFLICYIKLYINIKTEPDIDLKYFNMKITGSPSIKKTAILNNEVLNLRN